MNSLNPSPCTGCHKPSDSGEAASRRQFLKSSAAAVLAGAAAAEQAFAGGAWINGNDTLRVGLVGCGGRGTGAAAQALAADKNVKLVAMADAFEDRLQKSLHQLQGDPTVAHKVQVPPDHCFTGFDAYKQLLACGVDVVLLATPPHFRPLHLKAAVDAGKHVFAEKPAAVDAPGVRSVLATCAEAQKKGLSIVSGLCLRYHNGYRETIRRIHDGALGEIVALEANDYRGPLWMFPRKKEWTDMEWQMRNWYYFTWLSGDFNVEQHVHALDVVAWIMKGEYPVRAVGMGGRQVRTGPEYGNIYDHHSVVYEYASGVKCFSACRQQAGCAHDISNHVLGSRGRGVLTERKPSLSPDGWHYQGPENDIYQSEHDDLFASIRAGKPINHGEYMAKSTLMAILGRMATYTGQAIIWDQAMNSKEDLTPVRYEWGPIATPAIAKPGVTRFV
jgi:predicted dehydrogenase